eukprot:TRINITY_DN6279_c0_g1_i1.p1 TRINITY_DN6279_c0_g1~~TRINITY_DN6279_c0_g1_i1.p1  ORF type:complete len:326 (-),score=71.56 TRINITY_DN6279_c0_g1_i1:166-1143(-)
MHKLDLSIARIQQEASSFPDFLLSPRTVSLKEFLGTTPVSALVVPRAVVSVPREKPAGEVLNVLQEQQILGVLVEDESQPTGYMGFVDVLDVVTTLADHFKETNDVNTVAAQQFLDIPISEFVGRSKKDEFNTVVADDFLLPLLHQFANGVHRVGLLATADSTKIEAVVTQSDMLRFLLEHAGGISRILSMNLKQMNLVKQWVLFVNKNDRALHSFRKMMEHQVSAVAVLDDKTMVGSVSASDLRGIAAAQDFKTLTLPNPDFIKQIREGTELQSTCHAEDRLEDVCKKILQHRFHRLWVVDAHNETRGVISLTDICKAVIAHLH